MYPLIYRCGFVLWAVPGKWKQYVTFWDCLLSLSQHNIFEIHLCCCLYQCFIPYYFFIFFKIIYLFIYFWLCWVFVSVRGLSPAAASGGHSSSRCVGLSLSRPLLLRSTGSRRAGSAVVAHGPSCPVARGILPDQGSNLCPLHWQADSQPLRHQGSPIPYYCWVVFHCMDCVYCSLFIHSFLYSKYPELVFLGHMVEYI